MRKDVLIFSNILLATFLVVYLELHETSYYFSIYPQHSPNCTVDKSQSNTKECLIPARRVQLELDAPHIPEKLERLRFWLKARKSSVKRKLVGFGDTGIHKNLFNKKSNLGINMKREEAADNEVFKNELSNVIKEHVKSATETTTKTTTVTTKITSTITTANEPTSFATPSTASKTTTISGTPETLKTSTSTTSSTLSTALSTSTKSTTLKTLATSTETHESVNTVATSGTTATMSTTTSTGTTVISPNDRNNTKDSFQENCFSKNPHEINEGEWVLKDGITKKDFDERHEEDKKIRVSNNWAAELHRTDKKCGENVKLPGYRLFSQCNPAGPDPCCNQNIQQCGSGPDYCSCRNCTDFKNMISAELYDWKPKRCTLKPLQWKDSCQFLNKKNISLYFMGDSLIRHIHTVLLLHLTNDYKKGVLPQNATAAVKKECEGFVQLTKRSCSVESVAQSTNELPPNSLCKGLDINNSNLKIEMLQDYYIALHPTISNKIDSLMNQPNTWIIGAVGLHYQLNFPMVKEHYLDPVWKKLNSSKNGWPKMIWFENHGVSGFLREVSSINNDRIRAFNRLVSNYLSDKNIPIIPSFNSSYNVRSYDGRHYGIGFNQLKVQLLINYLEQFYAKSVTT